MATPTLGELPHRVNDVFARFRHGLSEPLRAGLDRALARRGFSPTENIGRYFDPLGQPVVRFPLWVDELCEVRGVGGDGSRWETAVEAAMLGYLYARTQDDVLDGATKDARECMLVAHASFLAHQKSIRAIVGSDPAFWELFERRWLRYAEALALEQQLTESDAPYDLEHNRRVFDRAAPLVLPGSALLFRAGLCNLQPALEEMVQHCTTAAQLVDDLLDAERDYLDGNRTWVVWSFGGTDGTDGLRRRLLLGGGFEDVLSLATGEFTAAIRIATELGMNRARQEMGGMLEELERLRRVHLQAIVAAIASVDLTDDRLQ